MFNVLVSANGTAWETDQLMRMPANRFKELSPGVEARSIDLKKADTLKLFEGVSTLLMYEQNTDGPNPDVVRYGKLVDVRIAGSEIVFRFDEHARFNRSVVNEFSDRLGLDRFEQGRTHWAIKDGHIPSAMLGQIGVPDVSASHVTPFISYARKDVEMAKRLYRDLTSAGAKPWLDSEKILGGQEWDATIRDAIRNSTHFIALISEHSVNKQGYVQKELRQALEILDEFPPNQSFVIPVRLDPASPQHERLRRLHRIDLFPDYDLGLRSILASLGLARTQPPG
jgi:TIR domain-containing protein